MNDFKTFAEYMEQRAAGVLSAADENPAHHRVDGVDPDGEPTPSRDQVRSGSSDDRDRVAERSMFKGLFKVVNPARPVSPTNSRLFSSPSRKRKLGGQIMGR